MVVLWLVLFSTGGCAREHLDGTRRDPDTRIQYYSERISEHPRLYPAYAALGRAYLDKVRETHDPGLLKLGREALADSIAIQPNVEALKTMAALCNFAHRFEDALSWGRRAADASPNDTEITGLRVESYLGLGRYDEARALLSPSGTQRFDFFTAAARGRWMASQGLHAEAAAAFVEAARFARKERRSDLVIWAEVRAAEANLGARRPGLARIHLDVARSLDPTDRTLRLHLAEYFEAERRLEEALAVYENLAEEQSDPEVHRRASTVARHLGQKEEARLHFKMAEEGFRSALELGEYYTLGGLARLYCDAGVDLDEALSLARRNLDYVHGMEAQAILSCVFRRLRDLSAEPAVTVDP